MRIGVDMRAVYQPRRWGTGKNLLDLYTTLARQRPGWQFVMFHRGQGPDDPFAELANVENRCVEIRGDRWNLWQHVRLPLAARKAGVDILHCPASIAPRRPMSPTVVTIHDLIPLDERFAAPGADRWIRAVKRAAHKALRVVTPSSFTRENLINRLGVASDKVVVNYWAPDRGCRRVTDADELARVRGRYGLGDRPYVFGFGAADPRKNTRGALAAWAKLPAALRASHQLLLVGIADSAMPALTEQVMSLGISDEVVLAGFADEADIPALLSGAAVLCYPSLSEGFGLPVLDAFVCGAAVLTSDATSLPEVAGDAAVLVDSESPGAIADGLTRLLSDDALRADLAARGEKRVQTFTWDGCAQKIGQVFEDACGKG